MKMFAGCHFPFSLLVSGSFPFSLLVLGAFPFPFSQPPNLLSNFSWAYRYMYQGGSVRCRAMPTQFVPCYIKTCHAITICAMPGESVPCRASPDCARPKRAVPCRAKPKRARPKTCRAVPAQNVPDQIVPCCAISSSHAIALRAATSRPFRLHTRILFIRLPRRNELFYTTPRAWRRWVSHA